MSYITKGLTNGGVTAHYQFSYDETLGGKGGSSPPGRTQSSRPAKAITT